MSVATNNILKLLSELSVSADKVVEENVSECKQNVLEWISLVQNKADKIVGESESDTGESEEMPSLMSYLRGTSERGPRVSTVVSQVQRQHLHRTSKGSIKGRKSRQSGSILKKTPLRLKSNVVHAENTPKFKKIPPTVIIKTGIVFSQNVNSSTSSIERKETPPSSKRKSSSELLLENVKKPKFDELIGDSEEREKITAENPFRLEKKQLKAKNSSLLPNYANIKSSVSSVLKENRTLRSKMETKQDKAVENLKNIMALRQQKLEQSKKTREEKLEKTLKQRLELEKQKISKLRSGGREKTTQKIVAEKNETLGETSKKNSMKKSDKEKQTSVKKLQLNLKKMVTPSVLKNSEKTPVKKNQKKQILNATYIANGEGEKTSTKSSKGKTLKEVNINMKDISKTTQTHTKGTKTVKQIEPQKQLINSANTSTPAQKKKGAESYAITPHSSFVSYDISEIRSDSEEEEQETNSKPIPSWATGAGIDGSHWDYGWDSQAPPSGTAAAVVATSLHEGKHGHGAVSQQLPSVRAPEILGVRLRNALLQQHHHPIDTDELFGNIVDLPDLAVIMGIKKKHYNKRTSSAVWANSSFS